MSHQYTCKKCNQIYSQADYQEDRFCRNCDSHLQPYIPPRRKKYWIFQANPKTFNICKWWKDHPNDDSITWSIRQYDDEVRKGDQGIIWLSGNKSGIYAIVEVTTNPGKLNHTEEEKLYWTDRKELSKISKRAVLEYRNRLFDQPIDRQFCQNDKVLSGLSILRQAQRTVFRITEEQLERISELIQLQARDANQSQ